MLKIIVLTGVLIPGQTIFIPVKSEKKITIHTKGKDLEKRKPLN